MFEDDFDMDEILDCSESTNGSSKRLSSGFVEENANKRLKIDSTVNHGVTTKPTANQKVFRFKKKQNLPNEQQNRSSVLEDIENNSVKQLQDENIIHNKSILNSCNKQTPTIKNAETFNGSCVKKSPGYVRSSSDFRITNDKSVTKRRFPGPAGLLPDRSLSFVDLDQIDQSDRTEAKDEVCSQESFVNFDEETWIRMLGDYKTLPEKYNIQWIKSRIFINKLINQKAPFLAAAVHSISSHSIQNPIVNLVLKDQTGTIQGTILHNLYEEHVERISVGSVIALRDVGVLNMGSNEEPYLTITRNNLLSIYSNKKQNDEGLPQISKDVLKTVVQDISVAAIEKKISETKNLQNEDTKRPKSFSESLRKIAQNVNSDKTPNLSVLRLKSSNSISFPHQNTVNSPKSSKTKEISDIINLFGDNGDMEEFFNDEPNFCSTQKNESIEAKTETLAGQSCDKNKLVEDLFDGMDASALFDEF